MDYRVRYYFTVSNIFIDLWQLYKGWQSKIWKMKGTWILQIKHLYLLDNVLQIIYQAKQSVFTWLFVITSVSLCCGTTKHVNWSCVLCHTKQMMYLFDVTSTPIRLKQSVYYFIYVTWPAMVKRKTSSSLRGQVALYALWDHRRWAPAVMPKPDVYTKTSARIKKHTETLK